MFNETSTVITTGVNGYAYEIDQNEHTDPGSEIKFKEGETIKISRLKINEGYFIHIKAIDNAGNESEILDMPLEFTFTELKLYKTYQEASDFDEYGIARTPGWNYINIDWNEMKEGEDEPVVTYQVPDICFVIDCSGSMDGNKIKAVKEGNKVLVENVLEKYPETKISLVAFDHNALVRVTSSNNKETIIEGLNHIEDKLFRRNKN